MSYKEQNLNLKIREETSLPIRDPRLTSPLVRQDEKDVPSRMGLIDFFLPAKARRPSARRSPVAPPFPPPERRSTFRLQDYLPQAVEEREITERVGAIQEHLVNHINYFYCFKMTPSVSTTDPFETNEPPLQPGEILRQPTMASITSLQTGSSKSIQPISPGLVAVEDRRQRARVYCMIADTLIKGIQPARAGECAYFLPKELTVLLSALPLPENMEDNQAFTSALSQWRVLSMYLFKQKPVRKANEINFQKGLGKKIEEVLQSLDRDLAPYIDESRDNEERREHLRDLMKITSDLGVLITSQAAVFQFSWDYEFEDDRDSPREAAELRDSRSDRENHHASAKQKRSRGSRGVTVLFPALLMTTGHNGIRLTKPVCICEPQTERLKTRMFRRRTEEIH